MSRTVQYILTIVLIIVGTMWVVTVYRSCQEAKTVDGTDGTVDDAITEVIDTSNTDDLEALYDENDTAVDTSGLSTGLEEDEDEYEEDEYEEEETVDDVVEETPPTMLGGEYLVVAGAFVAESNAKQFQKELEEEDYDAEIRVFLGSDYHSVILGNYDTEREATKVAKAIGGEAYVHKKRYPKKRN